MKWDKEKIDILTKFYPIKGKLWCVENLGFTEAQVRQKASRLKLRARGNSDAWLEGQIRAANSKVGKKRPSQSEVMKKLHAENRLNISFESRSKASVKGWENTDRKKRDFSNFDHPKGMLGKKHSETTKAKISLASQQTWASMSENKKQERNVKIVKSRAANGNYAVARPTASWKAGWREIGPKRKYYRSRWEANYARYLEWLRERGEIKSWAHEPKIFWFEGIKRGTVSYLPDFCVTENNGTEVYHEVKGWMDKRSITKLKRMKKYYPNVKLVVIARKEYEAIAKSVSTLIKGWE